MNTSPLTIVSLDVTNFARIKAVHLEPDPSGAVIISGRNAQGKSSVLAAIAQVIDSSKYKLPLPVHMGADAADIVAVLGRDGVPELVVKWKMTAAGKKTFTVEDADGIKKSSPTTLMKSLFGYLSVNPFAFATADKDTQLKTLIGTTGFDVDEWTAERKRIFDNRTIINREKARREQSLSMIPAPPVDAPRETRSAKDLVAAYEQHTADAAKLAEANDSYSRWTNHVLELRAQLEAAEQSQHQAAEYLASVTASYGGAEALAAETRRQMDQLDAANEAAATAAKYDELRADLANFVKESESLNEKLSAKDADLKNAMAQVDIPIGGVDFDHETGITLNGVPFAAASHAEKITIGTALAIASQPEAGVILVEDASLMDETTTSIITRMAQKHGMQVWLETVGETDGVVIEDGEIRG